MLVSFNYARQSNDIPETDNSVDVSQKIRCFGWYYQKWWGYFSSELVFEALFFLLALFLEAAFFLPTLTLFTWPPSGFCEPKDKKMAGQEGFEPPTLGFGVRRSSRSSYWPTHSPNTILYFVSLCTVCALQNLQYFLNSSLSGVVLLFFVVV